MESGTLIWILACPFLGAAFLGLLSFIHPSRWDRYAGWIASGLLFLSFAPVFSGVLGFLSSDAAAQPVVASLGSWMELGNYNIEFQFLFDGLSSVLCAVVTGVGLLIHIYSIGYMDHEKGSTRYFAYLNLFCGFMLVLVTATSLPVLFIGWEGVGLCSYLLIGYWYTDPKNAYAGRKAFVVNRIGDAGLLLGMFLAFTVFHSFDLQTIGKGVAAIPASHLWTLELMALLFFVGCVGKSAQFPLYIWLPDAMAGPTPVSALIHAATMVTSGVYLLARLAPLYALTPMAADVVACTGAFTALFAASVALVQDDIKKVLAFSTVSQLGFMVCAMGVGAQWAGMFHLVTHAFFKGLLFLGAGSVIHAMRGEQNIFRMGGLRTYTVFTTLTFFAGYVGIIGFPPIFSSGWYSKDAIMYSAFETGHTVLFGMLIVAALLTVIYMSRLCSLVFLGVPKLPKTQLHEIHESPNRMLLPMWALAALSISGGWFPVDTVFKAIFGIQTSEAASHETWLTETSFSWLFALPVFVALALTFKFYSPQWVTRLKPLARSAMKNVLYDQYRFDRLATAVGQRVAGFLSSISRLIDEHVIDKLVNGVANKVEAASGTFARLQTGWIQVYALTLVLGCALVGWTLLKNGVH
jgi:NADH-quinone oxidoreductase subunit L